MIIIKKNNNNNDTIAANSIIAPLSVAQNKRLRAKCSRIRHERADGRTLYYNVIMFGNARDIGLYCRLFYFLFYFYSVKCNCPRTRFPLFDAISSSSILLTLHRYTIIYYYTIPAAAPRHGTSVWLLSLFNVCNEDGNDYGPSLSRRYASVMYE